MSVTSDELFHTRTNSFLVLVAQVYSTAARQQRSHSINEVITDFGAELSVGGAVAPGPPPSRCPTASACAPFRDAIEVGLLRGRNAMAIWQELVDTCGFTGSYQSVQRFVRKLHPGRST